jgi:tyrosyl-tRNA synthetase
MNCQESLELIKDNLAEIIGLKELEEKILSGQTLKIYWGTAPTGKPHLGYMIPMIKIAQFIKAGCEVTIMFADLHAYLDAMKTSWELLSYRTRYYEELIKQILLVLQVDITKIKFVRGSDYQLTKEYTIDVYKFASKLSTSAAQKAGAEVVKQSDNPYLSGLIYPILQVLDEVYLKTDAELGGIDQRKIFMMSHDHIHKIGYKPNIHLMNKMIPSLSAQITEKMSSSEANSKIELTESEKSIRKKINKAYLVEGNPTAPLFEFIKYVIFPINKLLSVESFKINDNLLYLTFDDLTIAYRENKISPGNLKNAISEWIIKLLEPIRNYFNSNEMTELLQCAYLEK